MVWSTPDPPRPDRGLIAVQLRQWRNCRYAASRVPDLPMFTVIRGEVVDVESETPVVQVEEDEDEAQPSDVDLECAPEPGPGPGPGPGPEPKLEPKLEPEPEPKLEPEPGPEPAPEPRPLVLGSRGIQEAKRDPSGGPTPVVMRYQLR